MDDVAMVTRWIAAHRFPFPDQLDWPATYVTLTNTEGPMRGVRVANELAYPAIVIVDGRTQRIAEIGDVVTELEHGVAARWAAYAAACKVSSTGARSFFVYVPPVLVEPTLALLRDHGISFAGVRAYRSGADGISIEPVVTLGDAKDHR